MIPSSPALSLFAHLALPDQLPLQVVDVEEGAVGADGSDHPHGPPGPASQLTFDLAHGRRGHAAEARPPTEAAHGQGVVQAAAQRGRPCRLEVRVGLDSERHPPCSTFPAQAAGGQLGSRVRWRGRGK